MNKTTQTADLTPMPRPEHPRPQLIRPDWINLNGVWDFSVDAGRSGRDRGLADGQTLAGSILVPFCPESRLSGIGMTDFMPAVWYRRSFTVPDSWLDGRVLIHFGAVDYNAEVWINGRTAGRHQGGYTPFTLDITNLLQAGNNTVTVCAEDDNRSGLQPRGKQSAQYHSHGCDYTRTTGIWQTVWLEHVPGLYIKALKLTPDPDNGCVHLEAMFNQYAARAVLSACVTFQGQPVGSGSVRVSGWQALMTVNLSEIHLWQPGAPALYDLVCELAETAQPDTGNAAEPSRTTTVSNPGGSISARDRIESYFGLRSISWNDHAMLLNGKPVFQRLILDQGFYPDGIYTAPSDDELRLDIERSMAMGFNGARLHQKIFEERFLYWADRLGYLVWGEHASWGLDISGPMGLERFLPEWLEALQRDYNHPALIGWCPFNETNSRQDNQVIATVYAVTKAFDRTRPVIDTSGYVHVATDIYDVHNYEQDVASFAELFAPMARGGAPYVNFPDHEQYGGQPYFVSEFGGIWWNPAQTDGKAWGYGNRPVSEADFISRFTGLVDTLLDNPAICAFCYTQLTDVEQEVNGLYTYDRQAKFPPEVIRRIISRKAAIES